MDAVDLFAGPGGWDVAARDLGVDTIGIEWEPNAVATRMCAGLETLDMDVRQVDPTMFIGTDGLIASPPCPTFSVAGSGEGRRNLDKVLQAVYTIDRHDGDLTPAQLQGILAGLDERTALVVDPLIWAVIMRPRWIAFEQVPPVYPIWQVMAALLTRRGYHARAELLNAEQYGVPQTRRRAILMASRDGVVPPVVATHRKFDHKVPRDAGPAHLKPWITMAEALGWGPDLADIEARARAIEYNQSGTVIDLTWPARRPCTAVAVATRNLIVHPGGNANGRNGATKSRNDGLALPPAECGILQSFPADYPWCGMKKRQYEQVGNAIPPLMAKAILTAVTAPSVASEPRMADARV